LKEKYDRGEIDCESDYKKRSGRKGKKEVKLKGSKRNLNEIGNKKIGKINEEQKIKTIQSEDEIDLF
jgi:hypothetical protein